MADKLTIGFLGGGKMAAALAKGVVSAGLVKASNIRASDPLPADYALFPRHPRRLGLRIYQLCPAIAIQDHLLEPNQGGQAFTTTMAPMAAHTMLMISSVVVNDRLPVIKW